MTDTASIQIRSTLTSFAELDTSVTAVVAAARRKLLIFDRSLNRTWDSPARIDALKAFCLANARNECRVVVHDTAALRRDCPRFVSLAMRFAHVISLRETREEAKHARDSLVIADDCHHVHRFHEDHARAAFALNDPEPTVALVGRFQELWEASDPASSGSTLGL